jgi:hypothetical protein
VEYGISRSIQQGQTKYHFVNKPALDYFVQIPRVLTGRRIAESKGGEEDSGGEEG